MANTRKFPVLRVTERGRCQVETAVVEESTLTIAINGEELVTLLCSPGDLQYLAVGFLQSQGLIKDKDDIRDMAVDAQGMVAVETRTGPGAFPKLVLTSSGGRGIRPARSPGVESKMRTSAAWILSLMGDFEQRSETHRTTGGVHSAALCDSTGMVLFCEDIGRHNAIDRVFGQCLLEDRPTDDGLVLTSGRVSSEILVKVASRNVPVIVSRNAPTDTAIRLAADLGIAVIGLVRGRDLTVYTNDWRVVD